VGQNNIKTGNGQKKFDLKQFCKDSISETSYDLFTVVIHKGTYYIGYYYGYIKDQQFTIGQPFLLKYRMLQTLCKFSPKYYGPSIATRQNWCLNYTSKNQATGHEDIVHASCLLAISQ